MMKHILFWALFSASYLYGQKTIELPMFFGPPITSNHYVQISAKNYFQTKLNAFQINTQFQGRGIDYLLKAKIKYLPQYIDQYFDFGFRLKGDAWNHAMKLECRQISFLHEIKYPLETLASIQSVYQFKESLQFIVQGKAFVNHLDKIAFFGVYQMPSSFKLIAGYEIAILQRKQTFIGFEIENKKHCFSVVNQFKPFVNKYTYTFKTNSLQLGCRLEQYGELGWITEANIVYVF